MVINTDFTGVLDVAGSNDYLFNSEVQVSVLYLNFRQHRDNRGHRTEQHVEADEELVDEASIRLGVEDEEQHDSNK